MSLHIDAAHVKHQLSKLPEHLLSWQQHGVPFEDFCLLYAELCCQVLEGGGGAADQQHEWALTFVLTRLLAFLRWSAGEYIDDYCSMYIHYVVNITLTYITLMYR